MKSISKQQIIAINTIISRMGFADDKRQIISQISNGRTESTTALTFNEALTWIQSMNSGEQQMKKDEKKGQKMVNHIIAMAHEMGVITKRLKLVKGVLKEVSDYRELDFWMRNKSTLKKPLKDYSYEELPKLVTQYKNLYLSWLNKTK